MRRPGSCASTAVRVDRPALQYQLWRTDTTAPAGIVYNRYKPHGSFGILKLNGIDFIFFPENSFLILFGACLHQILVKWIVYKQ